MRLTQQQQDEIERSLWVVNTALKRQGLEHDKDLRQSAIVYMCECLFRYDNSKNVKWTTFAYKNVYLFIKRTRKREKSFQAQITYEIEEYAEIQEEDHPKNTLIEHLREICTKKETQIIDLKLQGYRSYEIIRLLGITDRQMVVLMGSIRDKAKMLKEKEL